ncbi:MULTISPECIES: hypothetical protein [unclassified Mycobacterium]|uniref:hypothetical protein n=1 Tax=unclassified Mycobacterium TaxID=2642494 RepID=UPI0007FCA688|nr:hypothetical protein A5696_10520 [Mycobacterium sp. E2699]OBI57374.1 hypothetical protein A5705_19655 [Mycobacterium sp. E787]
MLLTGTGRLAFVRRPMAAGPTVGVGTVRKVGDERQVFIEVVAVSGETFIGRLARGEGDLDVSVLRPGLVVLVAFDPAAREELSLPDDVLAVHASWLASV